MIVQIPGKRVVNLNMTPKLWEDAKIAAVKRNITFTRLVEELLQDYLDHPERQVKSRLAKTK
jgi:hypothetical protein